ncbi:MAG: arsenate reductase ArsC [Rhodospirillaceae bacterium]
MRNVLFLCTGNSARSILAEGLLNYWGKDQFRAYSAGSFPKGEVHPLAIETLRRMHLPTDGLRSKSWNEFAGPGAPHMDYILTVCDQAAGEVCPIWPGHPVSAHWGLPDPAAATGTHEERLAVFQEAFHILQLRVQFFLTFRFKELKSADIQARLSEAGKLVPEKGR